MVVVHKFRAKQRYRADWAKMNNDIGKKIGAARREARLTQAGLADRLYDYGVIVQTPAVNKWENGDTVPNAYQLMAIIHALGIKDGMSYFTGYVTSLDSSLNYEGRRLAKQYIEYLESQEKYRTTRKKERQKSVMQSIGSVSAGLGEGDLDDKYFEMVEFPESIVPDGTDFAVKIDGTSMEPAYHDGQVLFVEKCETLNDGEVGVFYYKGKGYVNVYKETEPLEEDIEKYTDENGYVHPQIWLKSYNKDYAPIKVVEDLVIYGRVLT